eukprot:3416510-Rhodomonas_salina.2
MHRNDAPRSYGLRYTLVRGRGRHFRAAEVRARKKPHSVPAQELPGAPRAEQRCCMCYARATRSPVRATRSPVLRERMRGYQRMKEVSSATERQLLNWVPYHTSCPPTRALRDVRFWPRLFVRWSSRSTYSSA